MIRISLAAAAFALLAGSFGWQGSAQAQSSEEEVARQTARLISDAIGRRVGEDVGVTYAPVKVEEEAAPPSEDLLNTVWATATYNRIEIDDGPGGIDIFLGTVGYDRRFGSFVPGVSVTGAIADVDDISGSSGTATVSPYAAYIFNDYFFVHGIVGFSFGDSDIGGFDSESFGIFTEEDANVVYKTGNWRLGGKAGHRFTYNEFDPDGGPSDDATAHTLLAGAKVGYQVDIVTPYVGTQYEHLFPEEGEEDDFLYLYAGAAVDVTNTFSMDFTGQAEVVNENTSSYSGTIQGRFKF
jgi:hypothetical protein